MRLIHKQLIGILLSVFSIACVGLPDDSQKPLHITADSYTFNYKSGENVYEGNVKIDQGSTHLIADKVVTIKNKQHKTQEAIAFGINNLAEYITLPKPGDPVFHAKAKTIQFYPLTSIVILQNNVLVTQGTNSFNGTNIIYNMKEQTVSAPATKNGQATIIIDPKQFSS